MLGVPTSEAAMTDLTHTRAGSGATLIRAMAGLQQRLANTRFAVALIETDYEALRNMPTPMLTSLRFEPTQRHMVVIQRIEGDAVWVADPQIGQMYYSKDEFLRYFNGQVLVFE
jgi:ABC-type bacteriocin/lantibiotic exporter with double-glycine peptidase domain